MLTGGDVEMLVATSDAGLALTGNALANTQWSSGERHVGRRGDRMAGGAGDDVILGDDDTDRIEGGTENDRLFGGAGDDHLEGGEGRDMLYGDGGADTLMGGRGGDQGFRFVGTAAFGGTAGELRFEDRGGFAVVSGDIDGDGAVDFQLEVVHASPIVTADFIA